MKTESGAGGNDLLLARKEQEIRELTGHVIYLQEAIDAMERTSVWRLGEGWYRLRFLLAKCAGAALSPLRGGAAAVGPAPAPAGPGGAPPGKKVLFISHDAHRMGAPVMLLRFLRWFKENAGIPFEILLGDGGALRAEFEALAPVTLWREEISVDPDVPRAFRMLERAGRPRRWALRPRLPSPARASAAVRALGERFRRSGIGLVYSNTITNGRILEALAGLGCPVISHVHELDWCITYHTRLGNNEQVKAFTTRYIAVSRAVQDALVRILGVPEGAVEVIPPFVIARRSPGATPERVRRIREGLGVPPGAWLVGSAGTTDWRKGADLFVHLARAVRALAPERQVYFVWGGGESTGPVAGQLRHDAERLGLSDCVRFAGFQPDLADFFSALDVFVLLSREDPYPAVVMEAASAGTPAVCFEGSGGGPEFVGDECGFTVRYQDFGQMAERVLELLRSPEERRRMGERGARKVRERHDISVVAPRILDAIRRCMAGAGVRA